MSEPTLDARILHTLASGPPVPPKALAHLLGVHPNSVYRALRRLEKAGLVMRERVCGPWLLKGTTEADPAGDSSHRPHNSHLSRAELEDHP